MRKLMSGIIILFVLIASVLPLAIAQADKKKPAAPKEIMYQDRQKAGKIALITVYYWIDVFNFQEIAECRASEDGTEWQFSDGEDWVDYYALSEGVRKPMAKDKQGFFFVPESELSAYVCAMEQGGFQLAKVEEDVVYIPVRLAKEKWKAYYPKVTVTIEGKGAETVCTVKLPKTKASVFKSLQKDNFVFKTIDGEEYISIKSYLSILKKAAGIPSL